MRQSIFLLTIFCLFNINHIAAQNEEFELLKSLNKIKQEQSKNYFQLDTSLIEATKYLKNNELIPKEIDKDSLRSLLRQKGNYDYNVEYIEICYPKSMKAEVFLNESKDEKLNLILKDSLFNNIGFTIDRGLLSNKLKLIATQNYIDINNEFNLRVMLGLGLTPDDETIIIQGNSKNNIIYLNSYSKDRRQLIKKNEMIKTDYDGSFSLEFNVSKRHQEIPGIVEIVNQKGKVLSLLEL